MATRLKRLPSHLDRSRQVAPRIVDTLAAEVKRIFEQPAVQKSLSDVGAVPSPMTPDQFTAFIAAERAKWREVVQAARIPPQ